MSTVRPVNAMRAPTVGAPPYAVFVGWVQHLSIAPWPIAYTIALMKFSFLAVFLIAGSTATLAQRNGTEPAFDVHAAERFANPALACVHKQYPNEISHTLNGDA